MDIYKHKWTRLQSEIFSVLCWRAGEELSQREIAQSLKVSPTAVANSLIGLHKEGLMSIKKIKNINFVSLNRDNEKAIELKRVENLRNIYASGLLEYLEKELAGSTIILFGSYSYGGDTDASDIDLAIIGRKDKLLDLEKFDTLLHRKINIHFYDTFKNIHKNLRDNILNGIVLKGVVEL